jgi:hypothetical protein
VRIFAFLLLTAGGLFASGITPFYSGSYGIYTLGGVAGVTGYGAILFEQGNNNVLLLAGNADYSAGVIDAVTLTRDAAGDISGFSSVAQLSTAPYIDHGLAYAPNGDLFFTQDGGAGIGQIQPGGTSPAKTVSSPAGSGGGSVGFVPSGVSGAGNLVTASYTGGRFCVSTPTADGSGTYDVAGCANPVSIAGVSAFLWVAAGSPLFPASSLLVARAGNVYAYTVDANGLPNPGSANAFLNTSGLVNGLALDPVTGDLLVSASSSDQIFVVQGFLSATSSAPEPGTLAAGAAGAAALLLRRRRRARL